MDANSVGELNRNESSSFCMVNGVDTEPENPAVDDCGKLPSLESMLEAATDLQSDHGLSQDQTRPISGRLEIDRPEAATAPTSSEGRTVPVS